MSIQLLATLIACLSTASATVRPVVGIYAAPFHKDPNCTSCDYVAASYVKWLEAAGAQAVPIPYNSSNSSIRALFPQLNGILYPGGGAGLPSGAKYLFQLALEANENGVHFPVWGTCLGFEWLLEMVAGADVLQTGFNSENVSLALELQPAAHHSQLFGAHTSMAGHRDRSPGEAASLLQYLADTKNPPTMNNHQAGLAPEALARNQQLAAFFEVLSTNHDRGGREFVSTIEGRAHPVFGVQWHPEKNNLEWGTRSLGGLPYEAINHSPEAVFVSQTLANFFVGECRRNAHVAGSGLKLFWDYQVSQATQPEFEQCYLIPV